VVAGIAAASAGTSGAYAEDTEIQVFISDPAEQSLEYGQYWSWSVTSSRYPSGPSLEQEMRVSEVGSDEPFLTVPWQWDKTVSFGAWDFPSALGVGSYDFVAEVDGTWIGDFDAGITGRSEPVRLTITPASFGLDLLIVPDPNSAQNAIITARLTGDALNYLAPPGEPGPYAVLPEGVWTVTVVDSSGAEVYSHQSAGEAAGDTALSLYWQNVPADSVFTASASFAPAGTTADNFDFRAAEGVSFTSPAGAQLPVVEEPVAPQPDPAPEDAALGVPLAGLLIAGLVGLLALAVLAWTLIRALGARRAEAAPGRAPEERVLEEADSV
jgi:hypothetical protein